VNFLGTSERRGAGVHRPHLRLLRGGPPEDRAERERSRILIAGADAERRAAVRADLTEALPADTQFGEVAAAWEVLEQAPSSGVVMLAGDLDEVTAESLMHVLGHRHPSLPVVALGLLAGGGGATDGRRAKRAASATG
jgi:hypothetical protein